jgi:putative transcriptional regulator
MDNDSIFDDLKASLEEAVAYSRGNKSKGRSVVRALPLSEYHAAEVANVRNKIGISQSGLATVLGVSVRTVEAWEAGRNTPSGAAQRLLYLIDKDSKIIDTFVTVEG